MKNKVMKIISSLIIGLSLVLVGSFTTLLVTGGQGFNSSETIGPNGGGGSGTGGNGDGESIDPDGNGGSGTGGNGEGESGTGGNGEGGSGTGGNGEGGSGTGGNGEGGSGTGGNGAGGSGTGGSQIGGGSGNGIEQTSVSYTVKTDYDGNDNIYLSTQSYGTYTQSDWDNSQPEFTMNSGDINPIYFTSLALKAQGIQNYTFEVKKEIESICNIYPYYIQDAPPSPNDYQIGYPFLKRYSLDFTPYNVLNDSSIKLPSEYSEQEQKYYDYCLKNYISVPDTTKEYLNNILNEHNIHKDGPNVIEDVQILLENTINDKSNMNSNISNDLVIDFFNNSLTKDEPKHYASSAVLMYRLLGIPSRIAGGYSVLAEKDVETNIDRKDFTCWAEIYRKGTGWIPVDVYPAAFDEGIEDDNQPFVDKGDGIVIKPVDKIKKYDGTPLKAEDNEIQGVAKYLALGYSYKAKVNGERTTLGVTKSYITEFIFLNEQGYDVTSRFKFVYKPGKIQIYDKILHISTNSYEKVYDGRVLANYGFDIKDKENMDVGHRIGKVEFQKPFRDVGRYLNFVYLHIYDENENEVTGEYLIKEHFGYLEIKPRPITIQTNSDAKKYDGSTLVNKGYTIINDVTKNEGKVEYDTIYISIIGHQREVGICDNTVGKIVIKDRDGKVITDNYDISYIFGSLEVYP